MLWWVWEVDDGYLGSSANTLVCMWMQMFPVIFSNYFSAWGTVQSGMKTAKHLCEIWMQVCQKCFYLPNSTLSEQMPVKSCREVFGWGGFIFPMSLNINLKEEVIPFFRVLVLLLVLVCLFVYFHAWNHVLWLRVVEPGRIFWENILYDPPSWVHSWHKVWFSVGVINNPFQALCVRSGCSLPLATTGDGMVGWEDLCSDTSLLSLCLHVYFSSIFSKPKSALHPNSFVIILFWSVSPLNTKKHFRIFSLSYLTSGNQIFINSWLHVKSLEAVSPTTNLPRLLV